MNEVNKALEEAQADTQAKQKETVTSSGGSGEKKSLINKMRSRILKSDPRSASEGVDRTPIAVASDSGSGACDTPVKTMALIDPRSPGCVLGGEVVVERTPILVQAKDKEAETGAGATPLRGSSIPPFSLADTPGPGDGEGDGEEADTPVSDSPLIIKTKTMKTSTPSTIPLTSSKTKQPSNLLQDRLKEAASAALKDQDELQSAPAAGGEFLENSDLKEDLGGEQSDIGDNVMVSDNNESSLII